MNHGAAACILNNVQSEKPNNRRSPLTRIVLDRFTAFEHLDLELGPGINVFVGANGTGKTHLLKVAYAACEYNITKPNPAVPPEWYVIDKLHRVFLPSRNDSQRLIRYPSEGRQATVAVWRGNRRVELSVSNDVGAAIVVDDIEWSPIKSAFIPANEVLSHAPGLRSLYKEGEIHFEETHVDILDRAFLPPLRNQGGDAGRRIEELLEDAIGGRVTVEGEEFFVKNGSREIEFMLLAEGLRKLGLLWLLIRNGTLPSDSMLCWDEPEANLNPGLLTVVVDALLQLQRTGVQVLLATHEYAVLKELELLAEDSDNVRFHALYRDSTGELACESSSQPFMLQHDPIGESYRLLYDRVIERAASGGR